MGNWCEVQYQRLLARCSDLLYLGSCLLARRVRLDPPVADCPCGEPAPEGYPPCTPDDPCSYAEGYHPTAWRRDVIVEPGDGPDFPEGHVRIDENTLVVSMDPKRKEPWCHLHGDRK